MNDEKKDRITVDEFYNQSKIILISFVKTTVKVFHSGQLVEVGVELNEQRVCFRHPSMNFVSNKMFSNVNFADVCQKEVNTE